MIIDVKWSPEDGQYIATTTEYPSLSWIACTAQEASGGLHLLLDEIHEDDSSTYQ